MNLYDRYVDDIDMVMGAILLGFRWMEGRLQYNPEWEKEDDHKPLDEHTVLIMVAMANSIRPAIQMEGDWGSRHPDGCIPVLDLKIKTVLVTELIDPEQENK